MQSVKTLQCCVLIWKVRRWENEKRYGSRGVVWKTFKISFTGSETGFEWVGDYEITADEVLGGIAPKINKLEQAKKMLRELAETSNSVQSSEIFDMAEELNISKRTLENAKKELGIKARRIGNSWYWDLDKVKPE